MAQSDLPRRSRRRPSASCAWANSSAARLSDVLTARRSARPRTERHVDHRGRGARAPDLKTATAYVMPLGGKDAGGRARDPEPQHGPKSAAAVVKGIEIKFAPELRFVLDETFDRLDETRRLFSDETVRRDIDDDDAAPRPRGGAPRLPRPRRRLPRPRLRWRLLHRLPRSTRRPMTSASGSATPTAASSAPSTA